MTTIAAKIEDGKITIGADSRVTLGTARVDHNYECDKMFETGNMVIASTGSVSETAMLKEYCRDHGTGEAPDSTKMTQFFIEFLKWYKERTEENSLNNTYIIAHKAGLFETEGIVAYKVKDFCAAGSGGHFAYTSLYLNNTVEKSIEIATELDAFSEGPIILKEVELDD